MKAWFTQPDNSFSSYYQYDPGTGQFVRIRLELGRNVSTDGTNDTVIQYESDRAVGFSEEELEYSDDNPGEYWSVNEQGEICYDGTPLISEPQPGYLVYDTSDPDSFIHQGSPVTAEAPELPGDIRPKHLELLANDTMISQPDDIIHLTGPNVSETELAAKIQGEVCRITGVKDFIDVNDEVIEATLKGQVTELSENASLGFGSATDAELKAAEDSVGQISNELEEGVFAPTRAVEKAFGSLEDSLSRALASDNNNVQQKQTEIAAAERALDAVIEETSTTTNEAVARALGNTSEALGEASQQTAKLEAAEQQYDSLENTSDLEGYEEELGLPVSEGEEVPEFA
jgi:hypothetical protein